MGVRNEHLRRRGVSLQVAVGAEFGSAHFACEGSLFAPTKHY